MYLASFLHQEDHKDEILFIDSHGKSKISRCVDPASILSDPKSHLSVDKNNHHDVNAKCSYTRTHRICLDCSLSRKKAGSIPRQNA